VERAENTRRGEEAAGRGAERALTAGLCLAVAVAILVTAAGEPARHPWAAPLSLDSPGGVAGTLAAIAVSVAAAAAARVRLWPLLTVAAVGWLALALWPVVSAASLAVATRPSGRGHVAVYSAFAAVLVTSPVLVDRVVSPGTPWAGTGRDVLAVLTTALVVPVLLGLWAKARREATEALRERAERLRREAEVRAEQARAQERSRIAREMHDVVAHRVSLIVLQAGAAGVRASGETAQDLSRIRSTAKDALAELRQVLGVLREPGSEVPRAPQPDLADVERLVEQSRAAGVPVDLRETGTPRPLPTVVRTTAHHVVREALTNVHKHAEGAAAAVELAHRPGALVVTVTNTAPVPGSGGRAGAPDKGATARPEGTGNGGGAGEDAAHASGLGLIGLRERVDLLGGTLSARRGPDGGFTLSASLPAGLRNGERP
jgi:signal transduction histidine kinase